MQVVVGIDIGGTKLLVEAASRHGVTIARRQAPTPLAFDEGFSLLNKLTADCVGHSEITAIGVSIGGPIDTKSKTVSPLHQPEWRNVPLEDLLWERYRVPIRIEVDTDAAALGEYRHSQLTATRFLYITLSTGMGGGFLINGAIYRGADSSHPEVGHQAIAYRCRHQDRVRCECGAPDCLEALISGNGIRRIYGKPADALDESEWAEVAYNLGMGLRNAAALYSPDLIGLGGGVALGGGGRLIEAAAAVMREHLRIVRAPELVLTRLGPHTAVRGAVELAITARSPNAL